MDKFTQAELKGRDIYNKMLLNNKKINKVNFTENRFDFFDVDYYSGETKHFIVELKYRENYSSTNKLIQNEGVVLEKFKYDKILNYALINNCEAYYVMMFNDGIGYSFNLKEIQPIFKEKMLPKTSCGNNQFIKKIVAIIPIEKGKKFYF